MFRAQREVRPLGAADRDLALELCAQDPAANVYVAARIRETDLDRARGALLGYAPDGRLRALCWASANIVPVEADPPAADAFAHRLRRQQGQCSSIFGPADQVAPLWEGLAGAWRPPLEVRAVQPLMAIGPADPVLARPDPRVRRARHDEIDLVVPAAAAMFTEEIGYPPYVDEAGRMAYRNATRALIARGHVFVVVQDGRLVFKADIGSVGIGACQVQGVWVDPELRGRGIAGPAMAAVVELARASVAPLVTLYVNDYNTPALAAYRRVGFSDVGRFSTILF